MLILEEEKNNFIDTTKVNQFDTFFTRNDKKFDMSLTGVMDGCAWCEAHKDTWSEPAAIKEGFGITRSLKKLKRLWDRLDKNKKTGALIRRKGDFSVRKGLCHQPVTTRELFHFTVCHKVLIFENCLVY